MQDPPADLLERVRRFARGWAFRRGYKAQDLDDVEQDAVEWFLRYTPPDGWDMYGATLWKLPRVLGTLERDRASQRRDTPADHLDRAAHDEPGYGEVDLDLLLAPLDRIEREALLAGATDGDSRALAHRDHVTEGCITHRRNRARAHILEELNA